MSLALPLHSASLMASSLADLVEQYVRTVGVVFPGGSEHGRFLPPRTQGQVLQ